MTILFDMDGTLFAGDSQLRFARRVLRRHGLRRLYLLVVLPGLLLRALGLLSRQAMKRLFLSYAWRMPTQQLEAECRAFVQEELLPAVFPTLLDELQRHRAAGHTTVLCSASPEWWALPMGEALGFTHAIATPVPVGERVPFFPAIPPPGNNRDRAKLVRLAALGIHEADMAYTDSAADLPMLSIAREAVLVNPSRSLEARVPGARVIRCARGGRLMFVLRCLLGV